MFNIDIAQYNPVEYAKLTDGLRCLKWEQNPFLYLGYIEGILANFDDWEMLTFLQVVNGD